MKCNEMPERLVSLLYGEVETKEEKAIRAHLKQCAECHKAFNELKNTSSILSKWDDVTPKRDFVFVREPASGLGAWRDRIANVSWPKRFALLAPAGAVALFLILGLMNFRFSRQNGNWDVSFSLLPKRGTAMTQATLDSTMLRSQQEMLHLVSNLIQESEYRQNREMALTLADYAQTIERRRRQDLTVLGRGIEGVQRNTEGQFSQTNNVLNDLIKLTSLKFERQN